MVSQHNYQIFRTVKRPSYLAPKKEKAPPPSSKPAKSGGGKQKKKCSLSIIVNSQRSV
ncbi:hypothetical protein HanOQP8_Chr11g0386781 [Helianthus annuus]|nr:hypothetical protein HanLR1_Chr11g0384031 [Helianthus annuus]KAJ0687740.1 hypothetical protein HanOQP8_Chr11g0386781 [Helianthus annuus]